MAEKNDTNYEKFQIDETIYLTEISDKFRKRKPWAEPNDKLVYSYIPGTILSVFIKEGQKVKAGEELIILEAMKMRNKVAAPHDGKIKKVYVKEGEVVPKNHLMIEFE